MALSFEESKQQLLQQSQTAAKPMMMATREVMAETGWTRVTTPNYAWFDNFSDDKISLIDENKDITIDASQINISQESKSQFIPFEMPRYYDGIDLTRMAISIHFTNSDKQHAASPAVNVQYNSDKIRFAWLVDGNATHIDGNLQFEIHADGSISDNVGKSYEYRWKSKPTDKFNIVKSLCQDPNCEPIFVNEDWVQEIVKNVATAVAKEIKDVQVDLSNYYTKTEVDEKVNNVTVDLTGYATETYVDEKVAAVDVSDQLVDYAKKTEVPTKISQLENDSGYLTGHQDISGLATKDEVKAVEEKIPSIDGLATQEWVEGKNYLTEHQSLNDYATKTYVGEEIKKVDVSDQLKDYAKSVDVDALSSSVSKNTDNIASLSTTVGGLQSEINSIDKTPRKTYDVVYNDTEDPEVGENVFAFYEITNEGQSGESREIKKKFTIVGGGGGGTSSTLKIEYITTSPLIVTVNDKVIIKYRFSGQDSSGDPVSDGTATWKIGKQIISTGMARSGENTFDATDYISIGTQKLTLSITDAAGSLVTKTWTVQKINVRLESSFNDKLTYNIGPVSFDYTPYGAISKDIHFKLDGTEIGKVTTSSSGVPMAYSIPAQTHGAHLLETYITAEINSSTIESNHILKDIIWYNPESEDAVIGCIQNTITVQQYDTENIVYTVYDSKTETPTVTLAIDGKEVSTLQLDSNTQTWQYKPTDIGTHVLTITCRNTVKTINVTVEKLDIDVEPVTAGLQFDFNPVGRSNNDTNRLWSYSENADIKMAVSDNFDWENGGYQIDENGDQYFGIKAGTSATISYNLFADDARRNGKEFKLIFKTDNVAKSDAIFLTCQSSNIGLQMNVHEAYIKSSAKSLYVPYSEGDIIEWEFNIAKDTDIPIVMSYEDGTPCRPMSYTSDYSFTQENPVPITIGSADCDVLIYRMKAYNTSLSSSAILSNFIADARTATEMIDRYKRNQIYDENNMLTPESVAEACPNMRVIKIEAPYFTNNKKDFVKDTSVECIYKNGDATLDNWKFTNMYHSGQGTTSNEYGASGRNIDIIGGFDGKHQVTSKVALDPNYITELTLGDGTKVSDGSGKVSLTRNSVPNSWFNIKVNIASSEMVNNAYLQKRYNDYLPYSTPANKRDPRVKTDMEFVNCVVFIKESNPDLTTHREFQDTDWHYYALGNIGDSKKTDVTRAYDPDDMNEFCIEVSDNTLPNSTFQTGIKNSDGSMKYPITKAEWTTGNEAYDALYNNWDGSFEFRYDCCGDSKDGDPISTDEEKTKIRTQNKQIWRDFYEFVITSSDSEFVSNLKNWFINESALYWYLFTTRYTMIDNRAKNSFWHWAKHYISTSEAATLGDKAAYYIIDDDAAAINNGYRFDLWNYDNDTALGINNSGELTMTYGKEDTDYRTEGNPSSGYVFNAAESVFFCRVRDLMVSDLRKLYASCESKNCWSATSLINEFDSKQNEWPEELWRVDYVRKYERTYRNGNTRFLEQMMNGKKKYQRRQFERDQEIYMATKFVGNMAASDQIMFRCNTPVSAAVKPDYTLHLTPFSNMYLSVMFGNSSVTQIRAKAGQQYSISCPYTTMDDTAVLIYAASRIQSMGDISACYIHDNDFSKAEKLKELIIGNITAGYSNEFLTNLVIGNNRLLEKLDVRNTPNLASSLDLSKCGNLKELYATGSGLTGVLFANGGKVQTALLPNTLTSINMRNLKYLDNLDIAGYDQITTAIIENCDTIDSASLLNKAIKLNRARIIGVNWSLENTTLLDRLYKMGGLDKNGYNVDKSVVTGKVHVPVMREKLLAQYNEAWPDLEITYNTLVQQFTVTFKNDNGDILDIQYVDKGTKAVDPLTRTENPITTPTKESTVSTDYTFAGWDKALVDAFDDQIITATYAGTTRSYKVKYVSKGNVMQETTALYGSSVLYTGEIPTYTSEESAYKYYLFDGWDQGGYVNGDKTINAVYDSCEYKEGYFANKELADMRLVEIYMMTRLAASGIITLSDYVTAKDALTVTLGNDFTYTDIEEMVLISEETVFTGSNRVDTGVNLLSEDRSFVLAIDCKMDTGNSTNAVLAQCFSGLNTSGFKLSYNNGVSLAWGSASASPFSADSREVIVLRHIKGENGLHVYSSSTTSDKSYYAELSGIHSMSHNVSLVFGCSKLEDGSYEQYGKGTVYWSKLWYADLGDDVCAKIAYWPHEEIEFEACCEQNGSLKRYYLSDNSGTRSSMTFISSKTLTHPVIMDPAYSNEGGWAKFELNKYLNNRVYNALPDKWKQLIKQVKIKSSIGKQSLSVSSSDCYIFVPSISELVPSMTEEPYASEGTIISHFSSNASRICYNPNGAAVQYWTRSPSLGWDNYVFRITNTGTYQSVTQMSATDIYARIMISI
jgi:hypothetical protein